MASIANDPGGRRRILFVDPRDKFTRRTIRLGKCSQRTAESVKLRIESLIAAVASGHSIDADTARWIADVPIELADKLAKVELIQPRSEAGRILLGPFVADYIDSRARLKPNTLRNYRQTEKRLLDYFGATRPLATITPGDADRWRESMLKTLSPATVSRDVRRARQFMQAAVRAKLIAENPLADLLTPQQVNSRREYFVTREASAAVLDACPDNEWRLLFALSRFAGLRCPSEHQALKWGHVDWEKGIIEVPSPKTEHHDGAASRRVPLFPELRPYLEAAWEAAEPGSEYVIARHRGDNANLRTQFERIVARAGLEPWPRLFHNLRASRQTELTAEHPLHVVCAWIGNTAPIAAKHYLTVTEADFARAIATPEPDPAKAAQNPAQLGHVSGRKASHAKSANKKKPRVLQGETTSREIVQVCSVPRRGVEPLSPP